MKPYKMLSICILVGILGLFCCRKGRNQVAPENAFSELSTVQLIDIKTKWVSKSFQPNPPKLVVVPVIQFKVKNLTRELQQLSFIAVFKFEGESENLGDCFLGGVNIKPRRTSETIFLKSNLI
jgi:ribosomal protein L30E